MTSNVLIFLTIGLEGLEKSISPLCCTPETNIMLNAAVIEKIKQHKKRKGNISEDNSFSQHQEIIFYEWHLNWVFITRSFI